MKYYNYVNVPNWKMLQAQLIQHKNENLFSTKDDLEKDINKKWHCYFPQEVKEQLPDVYNTFKSMNLNIRQLIYFTNTQNDMSIKDSYDKRCMFIHTDNEDELDARYETNIPLLTDFKPGNALNIPMENCEGSLTLFYKVDNSDDNVFYPWYNCGGHDCNKVQEVDRFELYKPAVLRINVPHAVHNPHEEPRSVATFRFYENLEEYFIG
jgi:hypothetical protein